jgi:hypothetical protein
MRGPSFTRPRLSLAAALLLHLLGGSAIAKEPPLSGTRIELTSWLTASQRDFVLTLPELRPDRHYLIQTLLKQRVLWGEFDLDDDGVPERIVMIGYGGSIRHGADCRHDRCTTMILKRHPDGWKLNSEIRANRDALHALPESDHGWRRLRADAEHVYRQGRFGYVLPRADILPNAEFRQKIADLAAAALAISRQASVGMHVETTNRLTAAQRSFIRTVPAHQPYFREFNEALLKRQVYWAEFDLDGDGMAERFVILEFSGVCGSIGCSTTIFKFGPNGWELAGQIGADRDSLWVLPEIDNGWRRINTGTVFYRFPCGYLDDELIDDYRESGREPCDDD